jgi:hypothetical protein
VPCCGGKRWQEGCFGQAPQSSPRWLRQSRNGQPKERDSRRVTVGEPRGELIARVVIGSNVWDFDGAETSGGLCGPVRLAGLQDRAKPTPIETPRCRVAAVSAIAAAGSAWEESPWKRVQGGGGKTLERVKPKGASGLVTR